MAIFSRPRLVNNCRTLTRNPPFPKTSLECRENVDIGDKPRRLRRHAVPKRHVGDGLVDTEHCFDLGLAGPRVMVATIREPVGTAAGGHMRYLTRTMPSRRRFIAPYNGLANSRSEN